MLDVGVVVPNPKAYCWLPFEAVTPQPIAIPDVEKLSDIVKKDNGKVWWIL